MNFFPRRTWFACLGFLIIALLLVSGISGVFLGRSSAASAMQAFTSTPRPTPIPGASLTLERDSEIQLANDLNGNGLIDPGDTARISIRYLNSGSVTLNNVKLVAEYDPDHIASIANITAGGVDNNETRTITWTLGTLRPTGGGSITYEAKFKDRFPPEGSKKVEAFFEISSNETDAVSTSITMDVRIPKLTVEKTRQLISDTDKDGQADAGDTIRYTIKVRNDGGVDAIDVLIEDDYDQNLLDQPVLISDQGVNNGELIRWNIDRLQKGVELNLTYETMVLLTIPSGKNSIKNNVEVSSKGTIPTTAGNSFDVEVTPTFTATVIPATTATSPPNPSAGPTTEQGLTGLSQALLAGGFMLLALGGMILLGYLSFHRKPIPSTIRDGYILSLVMGTVIILGLAGSVERSAIAGLIGTVAGYVLRSVVEKGGKS